MVESQDKPTRGPGLVVRLTAGEREAWHAAARAAGYRQTAVWVREVVAARLAAGASNRPASTNRVPVEVLGALGRIGSNVNQLAHRANAAALASEPFPVAGQELEAVRRELAGVREALDRDRDVLAQGEREAIAERVRAEVLAEVQADRRRRVDELLGRAGKGPAQARVRVAPREDSGEFHWALKARLDALNRPQIDDDDDDGDVW